MEISFTGRQVDVAPNLRQYTETRLRKLSRFLRDRSGADVHVILTAEKHRRTAEITLKVRDQTLVGVEQTTDLRRSIDGAISKLKRQTIRFQQRRWSRKRRPKPTAVVLLNVLRSHRVDHEEREVLNTERVPLRFLTVAEAVEDPELRRRGVVVFRNSQTDRVNVLYRRDGKELTLIEPEA